MALMPGKSPSSREPARFHGASALSSSAGSIDWLCLPRFDAGACFAALLGGRLTIEPLRAAVLEIQLGESQGKSEGPPKLPLRLHIAHAQVDLLEVRRGEARYSVSSPALSRARRWRSCSQ